MTVLRLVNGADVTVKLSVAEALETLNKAADDGFVELNTSDGEVHIRARGVVAVIGEAKRGHAGFHTGEPGRQ